jgi:receptor protein-tyrosine kinase
VNSLILLRGTSIAPAVPLVPALAPLPQLAHAVDGWLARHLREVRSEQALIEAIGEPLLAARPAQPEALRALCHQLLEHWCVGARALLPIISARAGDGRSTLALALAHEFARLGERTLLIDADFRAPSLHVRLGLPNRLGLADLLDGRDVQMAACRQNLAVLVAGSVRQDPLELLSRERLRHFLAAAARPFRVVLVDTPAAERGPDFEIFAALARGALLAVRRGEEVVRLTRLRRRLLRCAARPVASVFT